VYKGIEKLHEQGVISDQIYTWANELRILRNLGAHASGETIKEEDARESLDFLKAILENVYDLTPKFEAFKLRRNT
jgi:hypothetical protein